MPITKMYFIQRRKKRHKSRWEPLDVPFKTEDEAYKRIVSFFNGDKFAHVKFGPGYEGYTTKDEKYLYRVAYVATDYEPEK